MRSLRRYVKTSQRRLRFRGEHIGRYENSQTQITVFESTQVFRTPSVSHSLLSNCLDSR